MTAAAALTQTRTALADAVREARAGWSPRATAAAAAFALAAALPALPLGIGFDRVAGDLYLAAAAVGLGLVVGIGGMPSLGQGAFVALGAFVTAHLAGSGWPTGLAVCAGALVALLAGGGLGLLVALLRPALVAVVTWLVAWLVALALLAFPSLSGGAQGLVLDDAMSVTVHYELALVLVALSVLLYVALARTPAGLALAAAREQRDAAETLGVDVSRLRAAVFAAGAGIGGLSGALAVYLAGVADAGAYGPLLSAELFIAVVLAGAVSPFGGLVGIAVLSTLERIAEVGDLGSLQTSRVETLLVAVIVVSALGATDRGLLPSVADWRRSRRQPPTREIAAPRIPARRIASPLAVEARGLTKRFGPVTALHGVDLMLGGSEVHALIGPNGSGKTTALRVLTGTLEPDAGTIVVSGRDVTRSDVRSRARLGIVGTPQATAVFAELTALENAIVGARLRLHEARGARAVFATPKARREVREARAAALAALETAGLGEVPDVLAGELPGAAQRRLMIAATLATGPRVLLLDEPAAGASRAEVDQLAELVLELRSSGLAILLVDHNLRLVRKVADRVTVLATGRTIATGTLDEVTEDEAVLIAYLGGRRI